MKRWFSILAVLVGTFLALATIGIVELGFRMFKKASCLEQAPSSRSKFIKEGYYEKFWMFDSDLGYRPRPDVRVPCTKQYSDGEIIYHVHYTTDRLSRRVTPVDSADQRDKFAVFFGCSFAFGEGLNDDETLPYFFGKYAPHYMPYNYAFSGYGPQQMLSKILQDSLGKEIHEKSGIMICVGAHVERVIGASYVYNEWGRNFPYYLIDHNDNLVRNGTFSTGRPILSLMYRLMGKSEFVKTLGLRYPMTITEQDRELTARIVQDSFREFKKQFKDSECYFVAPPGLDIAEARNDAASFVKVGELLRKSGINVLDFNDRKEFIGENYYINGDRHPTAFYNKELAKILVDRLGIGRPR
jgi:hypothetical protein